jgi:hypothetical protein
MDSSKHHLTDIIDARYLIMLSKGENRWAPEQTVNKV